MKQHITIISCVLFTLQIALAGNLEPSAPPGSTMKTLDQVEPRTPISSLPFTITSSGSYYVTGNLTSANHGIIVSVDNVTIDLCGFTITGPGSSNSGIYMLSRSNVEVRNGLIRSFDIGVYEAYSSGKNHRIIDLRVLNNRTSGIQMSGAGHVVRGCTVAYNGVSGVGGSSYAIAAGSRAIVANNSVYSNGTSTTVVFYAILAGEGSTISDNSCCENGGSAATSAGYVYGIRAGYACLVSGNTVSYNGTSALSGVNVTGIAVNSGSTVVRNSACYNGQSAAGTCKGIDAMSCIVDQNAAFGNNGVNMNATGALGTNYAP